MNQPYRPHSGDRQNNRQGNRHSGRPSNWKIIFRSSTNQDNENLADQETLGVILFQN